MEGYWPSTRHADSILQHYIYVMYSKNPSRFELNSTINLKYAISLKDTACMISPDDFHIFIDYTVKACTTAARISITLMSSLKSAAASQNRPIDIHMHVVIRMQLWFHKSRRRLKKYSSLAPPYRHLHRTATRIALENTLHNKQGHSNALSEICPYSLNSGEGWRGM